MQVDNIKAHWEIYFKDIDPDTGSVSQIKALAITLNKDHAEWIRTSLERDWYSPEGPQDPNRYFLVRKIERTELC